MADALAVLAGLAGSAVVKGYVGELLVRLAARLRLDKAIYHRVDNVTLPTPDGTTQIDHVIARKHHGTDDLDNLCWVCFACNNHKASNIAGRDLQTGEIVRLFHPRQDSWNDYFGWNGPELIGLTPIGRATVDVLAINLWYRRALRESLIVEGVFPPAQDRITVEGSA